MKHSKQLLGAVSAFALVAFSVTPAMAEGTLSGSTITNTVSVDYSVGGVAQTTETATDSFTVDRKVNVVVTATGVTSPVAPGQTQVVRTFEVQNLSNATVGFALTAAQIGGTPDFDLDNVTIFNDANSNGVFDVGESTISFLDSLAPDQIVTVSVAVDIDIDAENGEATQVVLSANAHEAGSGAIGAEITATAGANTAGVDTVLADGAGTDTGATDTANQGDYSASHTLTVSAAELTVAKASRVVWDPVNLFTNPKAIPGARVEYCISVSNASGAATATGITVSDPLPGDVTLFPDAYGTTGDVMINGSIDGGTGFCTGGTEVNGYTTGSATVSESLSNVAAGATRTLYFQVTID